MTENEAKTKWCPFSRVSLNGGNEGMNRMIITEKVAEQASIPKDIGPTLLASNCIASACMAWRTEHVERRAGVWIDDGYCGLAGRT